MSEIEDLNRLENMMRREWRAWYEKCAALEAEIDSLKEDLANAKDELKHRRDALIDAQNIYNDANNHRMHYLTALELIASFASTKDKTSIDDLVAIARKELNCSSDGILDVCNYWVSKLRDVEAELAVLKSERRWIPVSERLPEKRGAYYVYLSDDFGFRSDMDFFENGDWNSYTVGDVTHWMPPPTEPPESED